MRSRVLVSGGLAVLAVLAMGVVACALTTDLDGYAGPPDGPVVDAALADADGGPWGRDASGEDVDGGGPRSCLEVKTGTPAAPDGVYPVAGGDGGTPRRVYCNMTVDDGGWTLVGRTVGGSDGDLGWNVARGDLDDDGTPYSLGVLGAGIPFDTVLVGRRGEGKVLLNNAFSIDVGKSFAAGAATSARYLAPHTVLGTCSRTGGPDMLRWIGYTSRRASFFFRDVDIAADESGASYGVFPDGFRSQYDNCFQGAGLNNAQVEIFVR